MTTDLPIHPLIDFSNGGLASSRHFVAGYRWVDAEEVVIDKVVHLTSGEEARVVEVDHDVHAADADGRYAVTLLVRIEDGDPGITTLTARSGHRLLVSTAGEPEITGSVVFGEIITYKSPKGPWMPGTKTWVITLACEGRTMAVPYHTGPGHTEDPTLDEALETLLIDASSVENADLDDLVADMPYSQAHPIVTAVTMQTEQLRTLLGEHYQSFLHRERS